MVIPFLSISHHARIAILGLLLLTNVAYAGVDWTRYDDAPTLFLGWETSFYFAIAAIVLLGLSWILTDRFKGKDGTPEGGMGCIVGLINSAMIICAICSFYLLVPIGIVYFLLKGNKKK